MFNRLTVQINTPYSLRIVVTVDLAQYFLNATKRSFKVSTLLREDCTSITLTHVKLQT
jgi:hypothetical protein